MLATLRHGATLPALAYIEIVVSTVLASGVGSAVGAYWVQRGKALAQRQTIGEVTRAVEEVKSTFAAELTRFHHQVASEGEVRRAAAVMAIEEVRATHAEVIELGSVFVDGLAADIADGKVLVEDWRATGRALREKRQRMDLLFARCRPFVEPLGEEGLRAVRESHASVSSGLSRLISMTKKAEQTAALLLDRGPARFLYREEPRPGAGMSVELRNFRSLSNKAGNTLGATLSGLIQRHSGATQPATTVTKVDDDDEDDLPTGIVAVRASEEEIRRAMLSDIREREE